VISSCNIPEGAMLVSTVGVRRGPLAFLFQGLAHVKGITTGVHGNRVVLNRTKVSALEAAKEERFHQ